METQASRQSSDHSILIIQVFGISIYFSVNLIFFISFQFCFCFCFCFCSSSCFCVSVLCFCVFVFFFFLSGFLAFSLVLCCVVHDQRMKFPAKDTYQLLTFGEWDYI